MTESYATYCIIDSDQPVPEGIIGLHAGVVTNLPYRGIGVAVSVLPMPVGDIVAGAVEHEAVVERLMEAHTVLPMRFPTVFSSLEVILAMMARRHDSFRESLCRLQGRVEFGVKVLWPCDAGRYLNVQGRDALATNGRQYMQERYRQHQCHQALQKQAARCGGTLDVSLGEWAAAKKVRNLTTDRLAVDGVYLVDKTKEEGFRRAFANLRRDEPGFKYLLSGPWPPYSFVEAID